MKKLLLILLCLPMIGFGQQTYVPDYNFEAYLEANGMGNGISSDDYVTTANINTVTYLNVGDDNISDLTGIEDFIALTTLYCHTNELTSLDVSQNTALTFLGCSRNQLTSLDLSQNTALTELSCNNNQLTNLDVSNNLALTYLDCENNQLICLDISNNPNLEYLNCPDNLLEQLNTRNGNWVNMQIQAQTNNLSCVEVDNLGYANSTWTAWFDFQVPFNTNCNYANPCNSSTSIQEHTTNKELLKVTDLLGRETKGTKNEVLFYIYDDGTVEKRIVIE